MLDEIQKCNATSEDVKMSQQKLKYINMRLYSLFMLLILCVECASGEAFSSTADLARLVEKERDFIPTLEAYVREQEDGIADLRRYIEEIREINSTKNESRKDERLLYAGHPINAYNLIKRWYYVASNSPSTPTQSEIATKFSIRTLNLPTENDFYGATAALLRLQRTFELQTDDIAEGRILSEAAVKPLAADDFIHIGRVALQNQDYGLAAEWLEKALACDGNRIHSYSELYRSLYKAYDGMYNMPKAVEYAAKAYRLDQDDVELDNEYNRLRVQFEQSSPDIEWMNSTTWHRYVPPWKINYERLCRGDADATSDPRYAKDLTCRYKPGRIPWVVYKEETLSWNPRIGIFYDIISNKRAEMVKEKAYPLLYRAPVGNHRYISGGRIAKLAWLYDTDPEIEYLSKQIEDITGLETEYRNVSSSAEPFQVVNYGIGGQYEPHVDFQLSEDHLKNVSDFIKNTGDRISTFLYYLTDVRYGGSTVFPRINIRVPVTKNGAAFWYNAKLSGELDRNTEHAGCPVLLGQKWVVNKWIRQHGQVLRRPCALTKHAVDRS